VTLSLFYPSQPFNFPRSYCKGFITGTFLDTVTLSGHNLVLYKTSLDLLYNLAIDSRFYPPTSNVYSLDFVFDQASSYVTIAGVPIDTGLFIKTTYDPVDRAFRVWIDDGNPPNHARSADLAPVPGYWTPV